MNAFNRKQQEIYHELLRIGLEYQECAAEAKLILEHVTGITHIEQLTSDLSEFKADWSIEITRIINGRRERKPLAYCLGEAHFGGLKFRVIPGVLIPRTDTETLVEAVVDRLRGDALHTTDIIDTQRKQSVARSHAEREHGVARANEGTEMSAAPIYKIADIGVGSGAIAISLLMRLPECTVWGCDISEAAINTTLGNARRHNVHERLTLVHGDWKKILAKDFDVIVSNPPYVPSTLGEKNGGHSALQPEIYFEPREALFSGGKDGLDFYRQFAKILPAHFSKSDSFAAFEIGDGQEEAVRSIFEQDGWHNVQIDHDVNGLPRVLTAQVPEA